MTRIFTLVFIAACALPGFEVSAEPQRPLIPLHPAGSEKEGKRKPPAKKEEKRNPPGEKEEKKEKRKRPVNLNRCLDSCAAGGAVFINFCNDLLLEGQ